MELNHLDYMETLQLWKAAVDWSTLLANSRMKSDSLAPTCSTVSKLPFPSGFPLGEDHKALLFICVLVSLIKFLWQQEITFLKQSVWSQWKDLHKSQQQAWMVSTLYWGSLLIIFLHPLISISPALWIFFMCLNFTLGSSCAERFFSSNLFV